MRPVGVTSVLMLAAGLAAPELLAAQANDTARDAAKPGPWQIRLANGEYLWEVRLLRASGDSLVLEQPDSTFAVSLEDLDELRMVRTSEMRLGAGAHEAFGALSGANDAVYPLAVATPEERRRIVRQILAEHPDSASTPRP